MKKSISIIIPAFNEGANLLNIYNEISLSDLKQFDYEIIFVDDGSSDNTKKILTDLSKKKWS